MYDLPRITILTVKSRNLWSIREIVSCT